jgi:TIR domain-containing protein
VSDIFVSYASADRDRARAVAQALTEHGWSVWWDRTIPPGKQFDEVIEEALDAARCVIVLWSKASVASTWVKTEAAEAMRRKILVPVLIEDVKIPLEFRRLQAADLSHWHGEKAHEELQKFFASIETNVGQGTLVTVHPETPAPAPPQRPIAQPEPLAVPKPEPKPVALSEPAPPRSKSKAMLAGAAGIAALVVIAVGYTAYNERVKRVAMEERAERERRAAEEARRAAEEAAARAKLAQEEAAREAARRRADEQRHAAEDAKRAEEARRATADAAARAKLAQQEAARAKLAQEEAARAKASQEAAARAKAAQEEAARQQAAAKQNTGMRISWYDHALRFSGTLKGNPSSASLQATVWDLKTGTQLGNYDVPATVTKQGNDLVVAGNFSVPRDSVTPYPHMHTSRLVLRRQTDGSLRYIENCPQVGKQCYR